VNVLRGCRRNRHFGADLLAARLLHTEPLELGATMDMPSILKGLRVAVAAGSVSYPSS
jgi:hypothetical protein